MSAWRGPWLVVAMSAAVAASGCGPTDSGGGTGEGGPAGAAGSAETAGLERGAREAVLTELEKRWITGPEGWTTARTLGSPFAPDHVLRQMRELKVHNVRTFELSEADKLNGITWAGEVTFEPRPARESGDDEGIAFEGVEGGRLWRRPGQWTDWVDFQPDPVRIDRRNGRWDIAEDTWLLRGTRPTAEDFHRARLPAPPL